MSLRGKKVFVTGASGFIGGRLVEKLLLGEGAEVSSLFGSSKMPPAWPGFRSRWWRATC